MGISGCLRKFEFPVHSQGESCSCLYDAVMDAWLPHRDRDCIPPNTPYLLFWYSDLDCLKETLHPIYLALLS